MWLSLPLQLCFLILVVHSEPFASALWEHHLAPVPPLSPILNILLVHTFQPHSPSLCPSNTLVLLAFSARRKNALFLIFTWLHSCHSRSWSVTSQGAFPSLPYMPTHSCSSFPVNITYFYFHISTFHCLIVSRPVCVYYVDPPWAQKVHERGLFSTLLTTAFLSTRTVLVEPTVGTHSRNSTLIELMHD